MMVCGVVCGACVESDKPELSCELETVFVDTCSAQTTGGEF